MEILRGRGRDVRDFPSPIVADLNPSYHFDANNHLTTRWPCLLLYIYLCTGFGNLV